MSEVGVNVCESLDEFKVFLAGEISVLREELMTGGGVSFEIKPNVTLSVPGGRKAAIARFRVAVGIFEPAGISERVLDEICGPKRPIPSGFKKGTLFIVSVDPVCWPLVALKLDGVAKGSDALGDLRQMVKDSLSSPPFVSGADAQKLIGKINEVEGMNDPVLIWHIGVTDMLAHGKTASLDVPRHGEDGLFHLIELPAIEEKIEGEGRVKAIEGDVGNLVEGVIG